MSATENYLQQVIALQSKLYAYILTLLASRQAADDVLQETNLVLCRKANEFTEDTNFEAWAFRIARMQCLAYWKLRTRDRLVIDEHVVDQVASRVESRLGELDERASALRFCMEKLSAHQRELLEGRYALGGSIKQLAERMQRPEATLSQTLYRIRQALLNCVRVRMAREGGGAS